MNKSILYLAVVNLIDGIVTFLGLSYDLISEANFLMEAIYCFSPAIFINLKVILSFCLILFAFKESIAKSKLVNGLAVFASIAYSLTILLHTYWIINII
jgi:hypothetical protein